LEVSGYGSSAATATGTTATAGSVQIAALTPINYASMTYVRLLGTNDSVNVTLPRMPDNLVGPFPPGGAAFYVGEDSNSLSGRSGVSGTNTTLFDFNNPARNLTVRLPSQLNNQGYGYTVNLNDMDNSFAPTGSGFPAALQLVAATGISSWSNINSVRHTN